MFISSHFIADHLQCEIPFVLQLRFATIDDDDCLFSMFVYSISNVH